MLRLGPVPTALLSSASRAAVALGQQRLMEAQQEVSTGRHSDVGRALGAGTGKAIGLRLDLARLESTGGILKQAGERAGLTQSALTSIATLASGVLATLSGARGAGNGATVAADAADAALGSLRDFLSTTYGGQFVFSGTNAATPPLAPYDGGQAAQAVEAAFVSRFGMAPGDAGVSGISAAAMTDFLDTDFAALFSDDSWKTDWSAAGDINLRSADSSGGSIDASSNANAPFARQLMQAFTMLRDLGGPNLSKAAFTAVVDKAMALVSSAQQSIIGEQTRVGLSQGRIADQLESIDARTSRIENGVRALESVDPYEAAARVNMLMTQLESSYAVTARISRMSLLSYL